MRGESNSADKEGKFSLPKWVWSFSKSGKGTLVRVSYVAAQRALPVWDTYFDPDDDVREFFRSLSVSKTLLAIEKWITTPNEENWLMLNNQAGEVEEQLIRSNEVVNETSGTAEVCMARQKALEAGWAIGYAAKVAVWTVDKLQLDGSDPIEDAARRQAGPAWEAVQAVIAAKTALNLTGEMMRDIIMAEVGLP